MATVDAPRREELRAFLRSRRARLTPAVVGLPDDGSRRRTPGLRREELAALAGVGVSWYTWLEQGRDITASPQVLDALARALRLEPAERETLHVLARGERPLPDHPGEPDPTVVGDLIAFVAAIAPHPAYLLGPLTHVLAWNAAATAVLGPIDHLPSDRRTLLWRAFVDRAVGYDDALARGTLSRFRAEYARHAGEPAYEAHLALLREHSPRFAAMWEEHDVADPHATSKRIAHPTLGPLRLLVARSAPSGDPDLQLTVLAPADDATRAALQSL